MQLVSVTLVLALLGGCALPRTAMVVGGVTSVVGAGLIINANQASNDSEDDGFIVLAAAFEALVGLALVAVGLGVFTSGAIGLDMESHRAPPPIAIDVGAGPAPAGGTGPTAVVLAPPGSATAVLAARSAQLTTQIWVESRAGHCGTATAAARRLAVIDRAKLIALVDRNPMIARCVAYKM